MADSYDNGVPSIKGRGTGNHFHIPDATAENASALHNIIASRLNAAARKSLNPQVAQDAFGNFVVRVNNPGFKNTDEARTFDITRDSNGLLLGGNSDNPAYRQAVTGIANLSTNTVRNNVSTLIDVLHQATSGNQKSIGSVMQNMSMPNVNIQSLTPQMSAKWSTAYLASNPSNPTGNANRSDILGAKIPGFQVQWGGKFGESGAAHIWDAQTLNSRLFPQNERGESALVKAKREKNEVVGFGTLESIPGIPASIKQMSMGLPGQTQSDNVYARRVGFQMFGGDSLGEGTQLVNGNIGHLATYNNTSLTLNADQTNQFKSGQFGFQEGDIFRHKNVNIPGATGVQQGIFGAIPGLGVSGGSNDFTRIHSVQFDDATSKLNVTYAQYTNAAVASSKFQKKAQMQPASASGGAFGVRDSGGQLYGFSGVQAMPSPQEAANIGLNSLRTQFSEDRLKSMFMDYTQSTFRMGSGQQLIKNGEAGYDQAFPINEEVANHMWGSGSLGGYTASIMSSMGAAHFNASMKIGFTDQTITQQQYDSQNRGFEFGGKSYQRFSNPTPVEGGFLNVQAANVYADLTIGERYQPSYDTGRTSFSGAILDNMAYSHRANYDTLDQRQKREGNSALKFRQVMMANNDPHALKQLQRQRKIVDIGDLNAGDILANIPQDHPDRQGEFMRQLAASPYGSSVVRMNGNLMPSPREALQRVTTDKTGRVVGNFGAAYFDTFTAHSAIGEAALIGEDLSSPNAAYGVAVNNAYSKAQTLANTSSVIEESQAITQRNTAGGPAGSMPGLQPNEILMGRDTFYNMMGVNDLPENMRSSAIANINQMRGTMPDYFTMEHTMHPITTPHQALYNLKPVLEDEYQQRFGKDSLPDMSGGKYFISQTLATAHGKDFDGDTSKVRATGGYYRKGRGFGTYRSNVKPTSNEEISSIAAQQYEEQATLRESLEYNPTQYKKDAAAYARDGLYKSTEQILTGPKGFSGQVESQANIGPTYNTGIGKLVGFTRLAGNRSKAEAAGWIAQVGYQTATKEKAFNDPGFNRISQMLRSGNYDWGKQYGPENHVAGYVSTNAEGVSEYVNFKKDVRTHEQHLRAQGKELGSQNIGGSVRGNLARHIAEGFAMLDSSTESDAEYATKVAPNVARMMLPDHMDNDPTYGPGNAHNIMTQALIQSRQAKNFSGAMSTFSDLVGGPSGVLESVMGQGDRASSSMAMVVGAMQSNMYAKNAPAAMSRQSKNPRLRAEQYNEAVAIMKTKDTDAGSAAHAAGVDSISNREVAQHTISIDEQMRGARLDRAVKRLQTPEEAGASVGAQSRAEYFAGRGGLYNRPQRRAPGEVVATRNNLTERIGRQGESGAYSKSDIPDYDAAAIMNNTIAGIKQLRPDLESTQVLVGSGHGYDPQYQHDAEAQYRGVLLPEPEEFKQFVAERMANPEYRAHDARLLGISPEDMTHEAMMAMTIAHEFGHNFDYASQQDAGMYDEYRAQDKAERIASWDNNTPYEDIHTEKMADSFGGSWIKKLDRGGFDFMNAGASGQFAFGPALDDKGHMIEAAARQRGTGKGRKVRGTKTPFTPDKGIALPHEKAALRAATQQSMADAKSSQSSKPIPPPMDEQSTIAAILADEGVQGEPPPNVPRSGDNGLRNPEGGFSSSTTFNIANQHNENTTFRTKLTDNADVEQLTSFVSQGGLGKLQSYMETIGSVGMDAFSQNRAQLRDFRATVAHYNKAANAVQAYSAEAAQVAADPDHVKRLSRAALGVEGVLARDEGHVGAAMDDINRTGDVHDMAAQAKSAWEGGLPDKYRVSGKVVAKGMAGASNIEDLGSSLGELAKSVKNVTSVTQEQYKSMKALTQSYDAAEHVISKLTDKQQHGMELSEGEKSSLDMAKGIVGKNGADLDTIRMQFAKASMGGLDVQGPVMGQEERQQRLMEALNRGGVGGARARSRARDQGLYESMGEEGDEGGLDYLGRNFKSEGAINAIGGMMRLGNHASSVLHAMTHLTHNIINPIAAEIQQYGQDQLSRSQMVYGITGGMTSAGSQVIQRQGNLNIARQTASQQVYNTYAGLSGALGGQQSGMVQGIAQSVASPALSAAVGLQAIGMGAIAAPVMLGVGAFAAGAWLSGAAGDTQQISSSVREISKPNSQSNPLNGINSAIALAALHFNPQGSKDAAGLGKASDAYNEWMKGYRTVQQGGGSASGGKVGQIWSDGNFAGGGGSGGGSSGFRSEPGQKLSFTQIESQYKGMSLSQMITGATQTNNSINNLHLTNADTALQVYTDFQKGSGIGLDENTQQSIFGFVGTYGGAQSSNMLSGMATAYKNGRTDIGSSIAAQVAATGGSMFNPNAVDAGFINDQQGYNDWIAKGRAPAAYDPFIKQNTWTSQANLLNRFAYGAGKAPGGMIMANDDRYINSSAQADMDTQSRQTMLAAAQTNVAAFRGGYGAATQSTRDNFVKNLDAVGLGVFNQNEQLGLGYSLQMQAKMGGSGLSTQQLTKTANMSQLEGATLSNILSGDAWTTSRLASKLGNSALATIDTKTGLGINDYGVSADNLAAYKKADKLGYLSNVNQADMALGTMGIQRKQELAQRDMQMFQYTQQSQQLAVQSGMMFGGGTLNAQGYVQGGNMSNVAAVFAQNGMKFNAGNGMTQWQVQDAQTQISRQQQVFGMQQQGQQLQISQAQFQTGQQQWNDNRALQVAQFNYNTQYQGQQMQIDRSHQVTQQGWQRQDWQYGRNMSELQFGFQMRDADRNIRYARGRDRLDLMRQRDDATIIHAAEMGQSDKEKDRMTQQQKWSEEQFKRDEDHFKKTTDFQKQQMDLDKKYHDLDKGYQMQSLQMQQQAHTLGMQWMNQQFKLEDQGRLLERQEQMLQINMQSASLIKQQQLQVMMNQTNDELTGIATSIHNIMSQWNADLQTAAGYAAAVQASMSGMQSGTGSNNPYGGGLSVGGYMMTRAEKQMNQYDIGGYTGPGDKLAPRGVVHGGEYVIPQQGTPVVRGDNQESLTVLKMIASILERIEKNPAVVNAVINTNQSKFAMKNLNLTDLAHGSV